MVKKYVKAYFIILLVALLFLSACSNSSVEKDSKTVNTDSNIQEDNTNNNLNEDNTNENDDNVVLENTMDHCYTYDDSQPAKYEFYIAENNLYEKVTASNGGTIIKIWSDNKLCAKEGNEEFNCVDDNDRIFYNELYEAYNSFAKDLGKIMKIRCEEVPYDETVFEIKV